MAKRRKEPDIIAADSTCVGYAEARVMWENGEFSDWVEEHGFPITIDGEKFRDWRGGRGRPQRR